MGNGVQKMKKIMLMLITVVLFVNILLVTNGYKATAATGYQGYAIYRDGVFFNTDWHAGIMDEPYSTNVLPVTHHPGSGKHVGYGSWSGFLDGNTFKGVYKPKKYAYSADRDKFVAMGRKLISESIAYNVGYQVYYNTSTSGTWVEASEITSMRCDGLVEYIYEWYNFRVYGSDTYWDVSKVGFWSRDHHSGTAVTPKKQKDYLTLVTTSTPR